MRTKAVACWLAGLALALTAAMIAHNAKGEGSSLNVLFPMSLLRQDSSLVDLSDLRTVYEYYLAENLAVGLVRDDASEPSGYRPVLAESWKQVDPATWEFRIPRDLKWSDGSRMTGHEIAKRLVALKGARSRHLVHLSGMTEASFDESRDALVLRFDHRTSASLLHELSLADAAMIRGDTVSSGWKVTSGPYQVADYRSDLGELRLTVNLHCALVKPGAPRTVRLFWEKDKDKILNVFTENRADVYYQPILGFRSRVTTLRNSAPKVVTGHPTSVSFFAFNPRHQLAGSARARREFARIVKSAFQSAPLPEGMAYENQFIPLGFAGRLPITPQYDDDADVLRGESLTVVLDPTLEEFPAAASALVREGQTRGAKIKIIYRSLLQDPAENDFAIYQSFKGNQRDALGSWAFLFSEGGAGLASFRSSVKEYFDRTANAESDETRDEALLSLHRAVLDQALGVPFWVESPRIYSSDRVEIRNINPFDLRLRFYEFSWK